MQESKEDYLFPDKYDVVRFVMGELTWNNSEPARIHKSLYLLFGAYGVCRKMDPLLPRYLFPAKFYGTSRRGSSDKYEKWCAKRGHI